MGQAVVDELNRMGINLEGMIFTNSSKKDLIEKLSLLMELKQITYPNIEVLTRELQVFSYKMTDTNLIKYGAPSGFHDDAVISLALATWPLQGHPSFLEPVKMTNEELIHENSKRRVKQILSPEQLTKKTSPQFHV